MKEKKEKEDGRWAKGRKAAEKGRERLTMYYASVRINAETYHLRIDRSIHDRIYK